MLTLLFPVIITASLKIIENKKFRKFFTKGSMYCENRIADKQKAKESMFTGVKSCIHSLCGVSTSSFYEWKGALISTIDEKKPYLNSKLKYFILNRLRNSTYFQDNSRPD